MASQFVKEFMRDPAGRKQLFSNTDYKVIGKEIINSEKKHDLEFKIYSSVINECEDDLLLKLMKYVLPKLNRDHLSTQDLQNFYSKLTIELPKKSISFVTNIAQLCVEFIILGDPRAMFWKDIFPIAVNIIEKRTRVESKTGKEFKKSLIKDILDTELPHQNAEVITAIVSMFNDIEITPAEQEALLAKISKVFCKIKHQDLGNLALVTFQFASYNQLLLPILALDRYFYKCRYKSEFKESFSEDDIEYASDQGVIETEETVIYHFQSTAECTSMEKDIANSLKPLEYMPKFILSPFIATLLVSIAKISSSVEGNFRLGQSKILPFIKNVFKCNEEYKQLVRSSGWAKSIDSDFVDTDILLKILKQNTCMLKQDIALNGLLGLSFLLLKTKGSPTLNKFAIDFLNELIRNRPEFTNDIMQVVVKMLFYEDNKLPIVECFSTIIQNRSLNISSCESALEKLIEDLIELKIETALAIESVLFTVISKSIKLRDLMIDVMKSAIYQRSEDIRKLAIFSFCIMLRKFSRPPVGGNQAHHNLSMLSLTQSQMPISSDSNIRQVEILMLEILGILRKAFSETKELKIMLYQSLLSSVEVNTFIISNIFEFLEGHFRGYFDCEDEEKIIDFDKILSKNGDGDVTVTDDLGYLLKFMINLSVIASKSQEKLRNEVEVFDKILSTLTEKVLDASLEKLHVIGTINVRNSIVVSQFLNCIESLIIHNYHKIQTDNASVNRIMELFKRHCAILTETKKLAETSKGAQKTDKNKSKTTTKATKIEVKAINIWDIKECLLFVRILFVDSKNENINVIKQNTKFCRFVLDATLQNITQNIEMATEYGKIQYNRSLLEAFLKTLSILYKLLDRDAFEKLYDEYDTDCAIIVLKIFEVGMNLIEKTFVGRKDKWTTVLKAITRTDASDSDAMLKELIERIQKLIEWSFETKKEADKKFISAFNSLFATLHLLYSKYQKLPNERAFFNWILNIAKEKTVSDKTLSTTIIKLFFQNVQKHENILLIDNIANNIAVCYKFQSGKLNEGSTDASENNFSIISKSTVDVALVEFIDFLKHQLKVADCYIKKANSMNTYAGLKGQHLYSEIWSSLQSLETSLCTKLLALGKCIEKIISSKYDVTPGSVEKILDVVKVYYTCMVNLMKHFSKHHNIKGINFESISIQQLIKYSKQFSACAYAIPVYIENVANNGYDPDSKKKGVQEKRRDCIVSKITKNVPQMIFLIENYITSVAQFDAIAKTKFSNCLHRGEVRDFHIKNSTVKDAIEKALTESSRLSEKSVENMEVSSSDDESEKEQVISKKKPNKRKLLALSSDEQSDASADLNASDKEPIPEVPMPLTKERFEKNVRKLSKKKVTRKARQKK